MDEERKLIGRFVEVPPPEEAPTYDNSRTPGIPPFLRVEKRNYGPWRCCQCSRMQPSDSDLVWVPDGLRAGDDLWTVEEMARTNAYNGSGSGWCVPCVRTAFGPKAARRFWQWLTGPTP